MPIAVLDGRNRAQRARWGTRPCRAGPTVRSISWRRQRLTRNSGALESHEWRRREPASEASRFLLAGEGPGAPPGD